MTVELAPVCCSKCLAAFFSCQLICYAIFHFPFPFPIFTCCCCCHLSGEFPIFHFPHNTHNFCVLLPTNSFVFFCCCRFWLMGVCCMHIDDGRTVAVWRGVVSVKRCVRLLITLNWTVPSCCCCFSVCWSSVYSVWAWTWALSPQPLNFNNNSNNKAEK